MSVNAVHREEAFATVVIYHDESKAKGPLRIKIDTGSGGNALPLRTFKHMFVTIPPEQILQRGPPIKLSSYTGDNIKCFGSIDIIIRRNDQNEYHCQTCYVVEVTEHAILGLPACELLKFVSLDVDAFHQVETFPIPYPSRKYREHQCGHVEFFVNQVRSDQT